MMSQADLSRPVRGEPLSNSRSKTPVFVVGCPRSGTTLVYHMLLSAGNFAIYRAESQVFNLLEPRFGDLSIAGHKRALPCPRTCVLRVQALVRSIYRNPAQLAKTRRSHQLAPFIRRKLGSIGDAMLRQLIIRRT
jgi:hypothetical protein